jgi:hypothetical protein
MLAMALLATQPAICGNHVRCKMDMKFREKDHDHVASAGRT